MSENEIKTRKQIMITKVHDEDAWYVQSDSNPDEMYKVTLHSCECKAFQYRGGICKHIDKVITHLVDGINNMPREDLVTLLEKSIDLIQKKKIKVEYEP